MKTGTLLSRIDILGTEYCIIESNEHQDKGLVDIDGYCDPTTKNCVIDDMSSVEGDPSAKANLNEHKRKVTRHEIIHAFLYESGLSCESWGGNEEIVDWIAIQFPKILQAFREVDCL